jgi:hypothetical protein
LFEIRAVANRPKVVATVRSLARRADRTLDTVPAATDRRNDAHGSSSLVAGQACSEGHESMTSLGFGDGALIASDLTSPEVYARDRRGWHAQASAHRDARTVRVGPNAILAFEDRSTVRLQLQEMIRVEQISEPVSIQAEIDSYRALIPDGSNFKASFTLEFADAAERRAIGPDLAGIERAVWIRVEGLLPIFGIVDQRADAEGGAAPLMHRLAFELSLADVRAIRDGAQISVGIDHHHYNARLVVNDRQRCLLVDDLH